MSAYTTKNVTKAYAIGKILQKVLAASDEELAQILFAAIGEETLNNFIIVSEEYLDIYGEWE